jgi:hypothetical protein
MANQSMNDALAAWSQFESQYRMVRDGVDGFIAEASIIGLQMIQDVPTRTEYMKMIRAEADEMLAAARKNRSAIRDIFNRIYERRKELRLIAQDKAKATVAVLSKLMTKDPSKYQLLVRAADDLAKKGKLPGVGTGKNIRSLPLERLSQENLDDVFLHAIDRAGGSRKSITPMNMKMRGAGLLLLTVALAGLDIYLAKDKSFAVSKNVSTIAGGAGGAWAFAAAGLVVGGPVGGLVGLIVGGVVGSYVAEEAHFQIRGLHSDPRVDRLVNQYHGIVNFDEEGLGWALHREFLADLQLVVIAFSHLNEKRNTDADDVARAYVEVARSVATNYPKGALIDGLGSPLGRALLDLLYSILDSGWTTGLERSQMDWVQTMRRSVPAR